MSLWIEYKRPRQGQASLAMKKPTREDRARMCTGKRRYRTQADALDAARLVGVEREREAYRCPLCAWWHLTTKRSR